jgi:hypothetical protein
MKMPDWLKPLGVAAAVLLVALLLAAQLAVPFRSTRPPTGYMQPRLHWNTKNSTRFTGSTAAEVAARVSRAVYPAIDEATRPDVVLVYDPADWQAGLAAASLLRPLNAILLPTDSAVQAEIGRLQPTGSEPLDGARVVGVGDGGAGMVDRQIDRADIASLLLAAGAPPRHVIVVDPEDPATALLAAPWAAWSGDLVVFDAVDGPSDLPRYALGSVAADGATRISGRNPADTAVKFATFEDPANPLFGWGMNAQSLTGYRAYTIARPDDPASALLSANLARRGKPGPLLWAEERGLPHRVNNYLWSQRAAFWVTPAEGPFHHFWILGDTTHVSFPAQSQADYAVEIGPYKMKGVGLAGMDMLGTVWIVLGIASAAWIVLHEVKFLPQQNWVMRLGWPLLAFMLGPFGIVFYILAYRRPVLRADNMLLWDRPLWLQGLVATASGVGFGGLLMVATGYVLTLFGLPIVPNRSPVFWLGAPMVLSMIASYIVAVVVSWPLYQTPMLAMFHGRSYSEMLTQALPIVMISMASVSLAMFPGMWWLMMWNLPMMPTDESILWFGVMFFTVFLGFLIAWPANYVYVRRQWKSGLM